MRYAQRMLLGLVIIVAAFIVLWLGSPQRTGLSEPGPAFGLAFTLLFAVGFILGSMGMLGMKDDYPALLSGLVLYFIVGALIAVVIYLGLTGGLGPASLREAGDANFWVHWLRVAATWPLELVQRSGFLGYSAPAY